MAPSSFTGWPPPGCGRLTRSAAIEALQLLHAPQERRLDVHHPVGIGEIARQLGERALHLARALAEIALLERDVLRPARRSSTAPRRDRHRAGPGLLHGSSFSIWRYFSIAFSVASASCARAVRPSSAACELPRRSSIAELLRASTLSTAALSGRSLATRSGAPPSFVAWPPVTLSRLREAFWLHCRQGASRQLQKMNMSFLPAEACRNTRDGTRAGATYVDDNEGSCPTCGVSQVTASWRMDQRR